MSAQCGKAFLYFYNLVYLVSTLDAVLASVNHVGLVWLRPELSIQV